MEIAGLFWKKLKKNSWPRNEKHKKTQRGNQFSSTTPGETQSFKVLEKKGWEKRYSNSKGPLSTFQNGHTRAKKAKKKEKTRNRGRDNVKLHT